MNYCRVCGYFIVDSPWGEFDDSPSYEICDCCGAEFGNDDYTREATLRFRKRWLENGAKWQVCNKKPLDWNIELQMQNIPNKYRDNPLY